MVSPIGSTDNQMISVNTIGRAASRELVHTWIPHQHHMVGTISLTVGKIGSPSRRHFRVPTRMHLIRCYLIRTFCNTDSNHRTRGPLHQRRSETIKIDSPDQSRFPLYTAQRPISNLILIFSHAINQTGAHTDGGPSLPFPQQTTHKRDPIFRSGHTNRAPQ